MAKAANRTLDKETLEIIIRVTTDRIMENLRGLEEKVITERHERQRAAIMTAIRKYRKIVKFSDALADKALSAEDDITLQDLLDLMNRKGREAVRMNSMVENAATIRTLANHLRTSVEAYRSVCENTGSVDDKRRFRMMYTLYISEDGKTAEQLAECENCDQSTIYRNVEKACEELAILFFAAKGLDNL